MAVGEGRFQLYPRIEPPLKAGSYRFTTRQQLSASGPHGALGPDDLGVEELQTHVRVRSPQYVLPPDQVLSTYPPAGREGSFGSRLPQVVIRRRTLPWERAVDDAHPDAPWLALVLVAEGEAELKLNQKVADCVTPGVRLDQPADVELGNCLAVRQSVVHRIFPTQEEVGLLAHAREVDINDTELMMGDDDGFLAVVISNRLPLPGRDADGNETPVKYLACLVNLCGQWDALLDKAPPHVDLTYVPQLSATTLFTLADVDHAAMRLDAAREAGVLPRAVTEGETGTVLPNVSVDPGARAPFSGAAGWATPSATVDVGNLYASLAASFRVAPTSGFVVGVGDLVQLDPEVRFPVLLHWSFTSWGEETFESIMEGLDSALLGTVGTTPPRPGRPPLEVVETGHAGLVHRLRGGDQVRSWYRGPFVPHPTEDGPDGRLPLAHAADQVRTVVPDGREDISLAAAFEIGRLLGLSRPSVVAALLRWRQGGYQTAHLQGLFAGSALLGALAGLDLSVDRHVGGRLGALVAERALAGPSPVLGDPAPVVTAGRPVAQDRAVVDVLAPGLGLDSAVLAGGPGDILQRLRDTPVPLPPIDVAGDGAGGITATVHEGLASRLDRAYTRAAVLALAPQIRDGSLRLGDAVLPVDLAGQLGGRFAPDVGVLRRRLDLEVDLGSLPQGADALDLLMHARPIDEEDR